MADNPENREALRYSRDKLIFMGLVALDEVADHCIREPYKPDFSLRVVLAMLYAMGNGRKEPFVDFWRQCQEADEPDRAAQSRTCIGTGVRVAFNGICNGLGAAQTISFMSALHAARRAPAPYAKAYAEHCSPHLTEAEKQRFRFAEMLRETSRRREEDKERQRKGRECRLSG